MRVEQPVPAPESESRRERFLIPINPSLLLENNPAAIVLDPKVYAKMSGVHEKGPRTGLPKFDPDRYADQRTEVVKVVDPTMPEGFRFLPIDGHHRTRAAEEFQKGVKNKDGSWLIEPHPEFNYLVKDVTDDIIAREGYQNVSEPNKPAVLSSEQYLEEVIDQAEGHEAIASARTVAHLIERWPTMGGASSKKVTVLSALSILGRPGLKDEPTDRIVRYYKRHAQEPLMGDETPEERASLEKGLIEMADVSRKRRRGHNALLTAAMGLCTSADKEKNLAEEESIKQIHGLLYHPDVHIKLDTASKTKEELHQNRSQLGEQLVRAFREPYPHSREIKALYDALLDPNLAYKDVLTVLTKSNEENTESPTKRYNKVRYEINVERVNYEYKEQLEVNDVFSNEATNLIRTLSPNVILEETQRMQMVTAILAADSATQEAKALLRKLNTQDFPEGSPAFIARESIKQKVFLVNNSTAIGMLRRGTKDLMGAIKNKDVFTQSQVVKPEVLFEKGTVDTVVLPSSNEIGTLKKELLAEQRRRRVAEERVATLKEELRGKDEELLAAKKAEAAAVQRAEELRVALAQKQVIPSETEKEGIGVEAVENVIYDPKREGDLSWFKSNELFDPEKATQMVIDTTQELLFKEQPAVFAELISEITYKNKEGNVFSGREALMRAIVQDGDEEKNLRKIVTTLGLEGGYKNKEFQYIVSMLLAHVVTWTPELEDKYEQYDVAEIVNNLSVSERKRYLPPLLYIDFNRATSQELIQVLLAKPFNEASQTKAKDAVARIERDSLQGSTKSLFKKSFGR